jgi:polyphosphate kinase 2 (PPK2 family)
MSPDPNVRAPVRHRQGLPVHLEHLPWVAGAGGAGLPGLQRHLADPVRVGGDGHDLVFDRSHYEDVVVVRVLDLVERRTWMRRYGTINRFEERLVADGTVVVKCFLHISREESKERLLSRLDKPDKLWKFNPGDIDSRGLWDPLMEAYSDALERCNTEPASWHVIPADRKWYRNWAIMNILVEHLEAMAVTWPEPDYDVAEQRARLLASD